MRKFPWKFLKFMSTFKIYVVYIICEVALKKAYIFVTLPLRKILYQFLRESSFKIQNI